MIDSVIESRRRSRAVAVMLLVAGLAGCATAPDPSARLVGTWRHTVSILGVPHVTVLTLCRDGTFMEGADRPTRGARKSLGHHHGHWRLVGDRFERTYAGAGDEGAEPEVDRRRVTDLDDSTFTTADLRFGIQVHWTRLPEVDSGANCAEAASTPRTPGRSS